MNDQPTDPTETPPPPRPRRRRWPWVVATVVAGSALVFVLVSVASIAIFHAREGRPVPEFLSLAEHPDRTLQGTVAYTASNGCVRIVAAAGSPSRDVYCLPKEEMSKAPKVGKEVGPQLVWLPDGRLEITMFHMNPSRTTGSKTGPDLTRGWQKIVDVRTGKVEDVPEAEVPSKLNLTTQPTVSPDGRKLTTTSDGMTGKVKVVLADDTGSRTLLSAHGPGEYGYHLGTAFWAPNWEWVAADDGRILVITTDDPSTTRVLLADRGGRSGGAEGATFAVTAENLLTP